jgi:hypothetical protein
MINIIVNQQKQIIAIESKRIYQFSNIKGVIDLAPIIKDILDCAYYSGERICLETVDINGHYTEEDRWQD